MTTVEEIWDELYDILETGDPVNSNTIHIADFVKGSPITGRFKTYPVLFLDWFEGPADPHLGSSRTIRDRFRLIILDKTPIDEGVAFSSISSFVNAIETIIADNPTLNGKVAAAYVTERFKSSDYSEGDPTLTALIMTIETYRKES